MSSWVSSWEEWIPILVAIVCGMGLAWVLGGWGGGADGEEGQGGIGASKGAGSKRGKGEESSPPRNFTLDQLHRFNGEDEDSPEVYLALDKTVFDVTGSEFYAKGGPYHIFAGHDASRCLAKMSFAVEELDRTDLTDLTHGDRDSLDGWIMKFKYEKGYPVVGRLYEPPSPRDFTLKDLENFKGDGEVPEGAAAAPIYVAVKGDVFDVSYGGSEHYAKGCGYHLFAGRDASRALAKMSFDQENLDNPDTTILTEDEKKTLDDWHKKFKNVKGYPVVGHLK